MIKDRKYYLQSYCTKKNEERGGENYINILLYSNKDQPWEW